MIDRIEAFDNFLILLGRSFLVLNLDEWREGDAALEGNREAGHVKICAVSFHNS